MDAGARAAQPNNGSEPPSMERLYTNARRGIGQVRPPLPFHPEEQRCKEDTIVGWTPSPMAKRQVMVSLVTVVGCIFVAGRSRHHIAICDGTLHPSHQKQRKMRPFVRTHARKGEQKKNRKKQTVLHSVRSEPASTIRVTLKKQVIARTNRHACAFTPFHPFPCNCWRIAKELHIL